ncbi:hypothetical protein ACERZ8_12825 [Tateyamaria armeniaca]|uniref:Uncharacterized protein n=1 Tax=Tateyamaria armeniaca TaxID=2518930 RepID=A0ABW8UYN5_9RHOB
MTPLLILILTGRLNAHDGPHTPDMLAHVISAVQSGNEVAVTLELTGLGGPLVLVAVSTPGATAAPMAPVYVNFAEDVRVDTRLTFPRRPPAFLR